VVLVTTASTAGARTWRVLIGHPDARSRQSPTATTLIDQVRKSITQSLHTARLLNLSSAR